MAKVVYLLGAGASYGLRNDTPLSFELKTYDGLFPETSTGECSHIIEGLPIVSELPRGYSQIKISGGTLPIYIHPNLDFVQICSVCPSLRTSKSNAVNSYKLSS